MKFVRAKHFWNWFQHNTSAFEKIGKTKKQERKYLEIELECHLRLISRRISWAFVLSENDTLQFILTAHGKTQMFEKIERLVTKAPKIPGWEIIALQPPMPIDYGIMEDYGDILDPHNLHFVICHRPQWLHPLVYVCAEIYVPPTDSMFDCANAIVANLLGEKAAAAELEGVVVRMICDLNEEEKATMRPLQELPDWFATKSYIGMSINSDGTITYCK